MGCKITYKGKVYLSFKALREELKSTLTKDDVLSHEFSNSEESLGRPMPKRLEDAIKAYEEFKVTKDPKTGERYYINTKGDRYESQSDFAQRLMSDEKPTFTKSQKANMLAGAKMGDFYDVVARDIFDDAEIKTVDGYLSEIEYKNPVKLHITQDNLNTIVSYISSIKKSLEANGYRFIAKGFKVGMETRIPKTGTKGVMGEVDLIAYKGNEIHIIDFKSVSVNYSSASKRLAKDGELRDKWDIQQGLYSFMLDMKMTNKEALGTKPEDFVQGIHILPIPTTYSTNDDKTEVGFIRMSGLSNSQPDGAVDSKLGVKNIINLEGSEDIIEAAYEHFETEYDTKVEEVLNNDELTNKEKEKATVELQYAYGLINESEKNEDLENIENSEDIDNPFSKRKNIKQNENRNEIILKSKKLNFNEKYDTLELNKIMTSADPSAKRLWDIIKHLSEALGITISLEKDLENTVRKGNDITLSSGTSHLYSAILHETINSIISDTMRKYKLNPNSISKLQARSLNKISAILNEINKAKILNEDHSSSDIFKVISKLNSPNLIRKLSYTEYSKRKNISKRLVNNILELLNISPGIYKNTLYNELSNTLNSLINDRRRDISPTDVYSKRRKITRISEKISNKQKHNDNLTEIKDKLDLVTARIESHLLVKNSDDDQIIFTKEAKKDLKRLQKERNKLLRERNTILNENKLGQIKENRKEVIAKNVAEYKEKLLKEKQRKEKLEEVKSKAISTFFNDEVVEDLLEDSSNIPGLTIEAEREVINYIHSLLTKGIIEGNSVDVKRIKSYFNTYIDNLRREAILEADKARDKGDSLYQNKFNKMYRLYDTIINNSDILFNKTLSKIKQSRIISLLESNTEEYSNLGDAITETEKIWGKDNIEENAKKQGSVLLKQFYNNTRLLDDNGNQMYGDHTGLPLFVSYDTVDDTIKRILVTVDEQHASLDHMISVLMEFAKGNEHNRAKYPFLRDVIKRLKSKTTDTQLKNTFVSENSRHNLLMNFVMFSVNHKGEDVLKYYNTNRNKIEQVLRNNWDYEIYSNKKFYYMDAKGDTRISRRYAKGILSGFVKNVLGLDNIPDVATLSDLLEKEAGIAANAFDKKGEERDPYINFSNALRKLLSEVGIYVSSETIDDYINEGDTYIDRKGVKSTTTFKYLFDLSAANQSLFGSLLRSLDLAKEGNEDLNITENPNNHILADKGFGLRSLAKREANNSHLTSVLSFRDGKKGVYGMPLEKFATETTSKLRNDEEYRIMLKKVDEKGNPENAFQYHSLWLDLLGEEKFRDFFTIHHNGIISIKEKGKLVEGRNKTTEVSPLDYDHIELGYFQNAESWKYEHKKYGMEMRGANFMFPTMSDKSQVLNIAALAFVIKAEHIKDNNEVSDKILDILYDQVVMPELERIKDTLRKNKSTDIKGYDEVSKSFIATAQLNSIKINGVSFHDLVHTAETKEEIDKVLAFLDSTSFDTMFRESAGYILQNIVSAEITAKAEYWKKHFTPKEFGINHIDKDYLKSLPDGIDRYQMMATDFVVNKMIALSNINMLFVGDPALYNTKLAEDDEIVPEMSQNILYTNMGKRLALLLAPRLKLNNSDNEYYKQIFLKDNFKHTENIKYLTRILDGVEISEKDLATIEKNNKVRNGELKLKDDYSSREAVSFKERIKNGENLTENEINTARTILPKSILSYEMKKINANYPMSSAYFSIESTDGQEYTTLGEHMKVLHELGHISDNLLIDIMDKFHKQREDLKKNGVISRENLIAYADLRIIFQPMKPVHSGMYRDKKNGIMRMMYIKTSAIPLIPQMTQGLEIDGLRKGMEDIEEAHNYYTKELSTGSDGKIRTVSLPKYPVRATHMSGAKVGGLSDALRVTNADGTYNSSLNRKMYEEHSLNIPRANFGIQNNVPPKFAKKHQNVSLGSQTLKLLFGGGVMEMDGFHFFASNFEGAKNSSALYETSEVIKKTKADLESKISDLALARTGNDVGLKLNIKGTKKVHHTFQDSVKGSFSNKLIAFSDSKGVETFRTKKVEGASAISSTASYKLQVENSDKNYQDQGRNVNRVNSGEYKEGDVVFTKIEGGNYYGEDGIAKKKNYAKALAETKKALRAGAIVLTSTKDKASDSYNTEGEGKLMKDLSPFFKYIEIELMNTKIGAWVKDDLSSQVAEDVLASGEYTGLQLQKIFDDTWVNYVNHKKQELIKEFGLDENYVPKGNDIFKTAKKYQKILEDEVIARNLPLHDKENLTLKLDTVIKINGIEVSSKDLKLSEIKEIRDAFKRKDWNNKALIDLGIDSRYEGEELEMEHKSFDFISPLWLSANANKYEALFNSIVSKKIIKAKMPGDSFVVASENMIQKDKKSIMDESRMIYTEYFDHDYGKLKSAGIKEDGTMQLTQVFLGSRFRDNDGVLIKFINDDGTANEKYINVDPKTKRMTLKMEMFDKNLLNHTSFRIPTSSHVSMSQIEVAGFLPPEMGSLMIVPPSLIIQKGLDFDIDKETVYMQHTHMNENGSLSLFGKGDYKKQVHDAEIRLEKAKVLYQASQESLNDSNLRHEYISAKKDLKTLIKDNIAKHYENQIIDIHRSVLSNPNPAMQKNINSVLSMDDAEKQARIIDKLSNKTKDYSLFSPYTNTYQKSKSIAGAMGKMGIAVYSSSLTFHAVMEQQNILGNKISHPMKDVKFLGLSMGSFGDVRTKDGYRTIAEVFAELQNIATDNEKAQIMGRLNINNHTIGVQTYLTLLGFDKALVTTENGKENMSMPLLFINQPIIKEYVRLMEDKRAKIYDNEVGKENSIILALYEKFGGFKGGNISLIEETNKKVLDESKKNLRPQQLYNNLTLSVDRVNGIEQVAILSSFMNIKKTSSKLVKIANNYNVNSSGLNKSYFDTLNLREFLEELGDEEDFPGISGIVGDIINETSINQEEVNELLDKGYVRIGSVLIKAKTPTGAMLVNGVQASLGLSERIFPYSSEIINYALRKGSEVFGITEKSFTNTKISTNQIILREFKKYIFSSPELGFFEDATNERNRLIVKGPYKDTLNNYIYGLLRHPDFAHLRNNPLLKSFTHEYRRGDVDNIKYNNAKQDDFDEEALYNSLISLLSKNEVLPKFNGKEYTVYMFVEDLIKYSYVNGGVQAAQEFLKYIPVSILEKLPYTSKIKSFLNNMTKEQVDIFITQLAQHNATKVVKITDNIDNFYDSIDEYKLLQEINDEEEYLINSGFDVNGNPIIRSKVYLEAGWDNLAGFTLKEGTYYEKKYGANPPFLSKVIILKYGIETMLYKKLENTAGTYELISVKGNNNAAEYLFNNDDKNSLYNFNYDTKDTSMYNYDVRIIAEPKYIVEGSIIDTIERIARPGVVNPNSRAPINEDIYSAILRRILAINRIDPNITVEIKEMEEKSYSESRGGRKYIVISKDVANNPLLSIRTFVKELIHTMLNDTIDKYTDKQGNIMLEGAPDSLIKLDKLFKLYKDHIINNTESISSVTDRFTFADVFQQKLSSNKIIHTYEKESHLLENLRKPHIITIASKKLLVKEGLIDENKAVNPNSLFVNYGIIINPFEGTKDEIKNFFNWLNNSKVDSPIIHNQSVIAYQMNLREKLSNKDMLSIENVSKEKVVSEADVLNLFFTEGIKGRRIVNKVKPSDVVNRIENLKTSTSLAQEDVLIYHPATSLKAFVEDIFTQRVTRSILSSIDDSLLFTDDIVSLGILEGKTNLRGVTALERYTKYVNSIVGKNKSGKISLPRAALMNIIFAISSSPKIIKEDTFRNSPIVQKQIERLKDTKSVEVSKNFKTEDEIRMDKLIKEIDEINDNLDVNSIRKDKDIC